MGKSDRKSGAVTQAELAALLDRTPRQIRNYEGEGMPAEGAGRDKRYPCPAALEWYFERKFSVGTPDRDERTRNMALKNQRLELELAEVRGDLMPVVIHIRVVAKLAERITGFFRNLPSVWAPQFVALENEREAAKVLIRLADETIEDLASITDDLVEGGEEAS